MPTVLQISSCLTGSTGRITQQIGEKAIEQGWESWIAYSGREPACPSKSKVFPVGSTFVSQMHAIQTRLFDRHGLGSNAATKELVERIKEIKPDIIHLHNIHGYYINIEVLFSYLREANIPIVWTLHDCWAFTGHCVHYTDVDCFKWRNDAPVHCCNCPKKKGYPSSYFLDRSRKNYELKKRLFTCVKEMTMVPVSYWLGRVTVDSFLGRYPIHVIQNGIDISTFYPRAEKKEQVREKYGWKGKFVILGVATGWSDDVGLGTFYKLNDYLDSGYAVAMVGLTEKQKTALPKGITGILRTQNAGELAEIYSAADVLFNGSYQETFGLVTAEAMACGTPAIVYDSTACPEIVDNDRGRVIPIGEFNKLIDAILSLKALTMAEKNEMSATCVEYVKEHLDKDLKYQEYIELYNSLLQHD